MSKTFSTITGTGTYVSPLCETAVMHTRRLCEVSPYGDEGNAGHDGEYSESGEDL